MSPLMALVLLGSACRSRTADTGGPDSGDAPDAACLRAEPQEVDFGELRVGVEAPETAIVTLRNDCAGDLEIGGVSLGDPAAPFAYGEVGSAFVAGGTSTDVAVTFDPPTSGTWSTRLLVDSNAVDGPTAVALAGTGLAPVLAVDPSSGDLGSPFVGCDVRQSYTVSNAGTDDLVVGAFTWTSDSPDLAFEDVAAPVTVAPGQSFEVYVDYTPLDDVADVGELAIDSNDPATPRYAVPVIGAATSAGDVTDTFEQPADVQADIVFVIDDSGTMAEEQAALADHFGAFADTLVAADVDWQVGVISTDTPTFYCDPSLPADADPAAEFSACALVGVRGSGDEQGAEMAYQATLPGGDASASGAYGFLRDAARLVFVVVSDEEDSSEADRGKTTDDYAASFWALKGDDADLVRWQSVIEVPGPSCPTATPTGANYSALSAVTGGAVTSICSVDWDATLAHVAEASLPTLDRFSLSASPVPSTIAVTVDGAPAASGWSYDAKTNAVVFDAPDVPARGATVEVRYDQAPDCDG